MTGHTTERVSPFQDHSPLHLAVCSCNCHRPGYVTTQAHRCDEGNSDD